MFKIIFIILILLSLLLVFKTVLKVYLKYNLTDKQGPLAIKRAKTKLRNSLIITTISFLITLIYFMIINQHTYYHHIITSEPGVVENVNRNISNDSNGTIKIRIINHHTTVKINPDTPNQLTNTPYQGLNINSSLFYNLKPNQNINLIKEVTIPSERNLLSFHSKEQYIVTNN